MKTPAWHPVGAADLLPVGKHIAITINNRPLAIFHLDDGMYAIEDSCPHQRLPLCSGMVEDDEIECPFHGARFNIKTGEVLSPPAYENLTRFEVRIENGQIEVFL